ncbi:RBBP9/YdeN family alpha/beta hydrolase [Rubrivivax albus]|uniref:Serine hydrolase family protein n=1 Tax=Rubrivivax albus TaxID=2499835 RepID=A0A3S2TS51_9BURK|nr:alpha/beta hydrolase [Rubrivivax albus]RVT52785.1 serine hydrolase family protein [Rubrivivax albus]
MPPIYLLPGWLDSGPDHWQSRWERLHGDQRVVQDDWQWPRRGDWMARLDETLIDAPATPVLLAAHSLGCLLVAAWAAHSRHTAQVAGALLVAPPDTGREDMPPQLHGWRPIVRTRLPFPAIAVISRDDPYGDADRMRDIAQGWGAEIVDAGPRGHLNDQSGLGDWPEGRALLARLAPPPDDPPDAGAL